MYVREMSNKNQLTGIEICQVTWRPQKCVLIHAIPAIRASLVVLAIHEVFTRLPKMKMMPAIHKKFDNSNFAIPGLIAASHRAVCVFLFSTSEFLCFPFLPGIREKQVIGMQV